MLFSILFFNSWKFWFFSFDHFCWNRFFHIKVQCTCFRLEVKKEILTIETSKDFFIPENIDQDKGYKMNAVPICYTWKTIFTFSTFSLIVKETNLFQSTYCIPRLKYNWIHNRQIHIRHATKIFLTNTYLNFFVNYVAFKDVEIKYLKSSVSQSFGLQVPLKW